MPSFIATKINVASTVLCLSLSACATVNVSGLGSTEAANVSSQSVEVQGNVITRTVTRLYQVFVDKGWHEEQSRERVQSAANILLNGIQAREPNEVGATNISVSSDALLGDIKTARYHITQTTKAAEVYLDVASATAVLSPELKQLQTALRLSEKAQANFSNYENMTYTVKAELSGLMGEVDQLRRVTDHFGDVVRTRLILAQADTSS